MSAKSTRKTPELKELLTHQTGKSIADLSVFSAKSARAESREKPPFQKTKEEIEQENVNNLVDQHLKRMDLLPLPFEMLKRGLSEIGPAPDSLNPVYHKLSLPVY
jgi:hypothetical protein